MSFYSKIPTDKKPDAMSETLAKRPEKTETELRLAAMREEEAKAKRSKGEPVNVPLPRTVAWAASLPASVRPTELLKKYARVANLLASTWDDREATFRYLDELLVDHRGSRQGFPPLVAAELARLKAHYAGESELQLSNAWELTRKR